LAYQIDSQVGEQSPESSHFSETDHPQTIQRSGQKSFLNRTMVTFHLNFDQATYAVVDPHPEEGIQDAFVFLGLSKIAGLISQII
jgi:hypothetical protein